MGDKIQYDDSMGPGEDVMQGAGCACCTRAKTRDSSAGISDGSGAKIVENFGARVDGFGTGAYVRKIKCR